MREIDESGGIGHWGQGSICGPVIQALLALGVVTICGLRAYAQVADRMSFKSPDEAAVALAHACSTHNENQLLAILGPLGGELISSGDEVADKAAQEKFANAFKQTYELVPDEEGRQTLHVGVESWPLPVPIVKHGDSWYFDTVAGQEEMISRRIDSNELSAIKACRLYVEVQEQYASKFHEAGQMPGVYAQKLRSDPGTHNGLYWEEGVSGERSPAGTLFALIAQEGYSADGSRQKPYHGYYFRVLTAQGKDAPGGEKSYIVSDRMTDGFAMVAYPSRYLSSGMKTFIVNRDGIVYQQDLGGQTEDLASRMTEYNPDPSWSRVF